MPEYVQEHCLGPLKLIHYPAMFVPAEDLNRFSASLSAKTGEGDN